MKLSREEFLRRAEHDLHNRRYARRLAERSGATDYQSYMIEKRTRYLRREHIKSQG